MENEETKNTALAVTSDNQNRDILTASEPKKWKYLIMLDGKLLSTVGLKLGAVYELLNEYREQQRLCPIGEICQVMLGGNYPKNRDKFRDWYPGAVRRAREQGYFLVGDAKQGGSKGKLMNVALCPQNPPQYIRVLAEAQLMQQLRRQEISTATVAKWKAFLDGSNV